MNTNQSSPPSIKYPCEVYKYCNQFLDKYQTVTLPYSYLSLLGNIIEHSNMSEYSIVLLWNDESSAITGFELTSIC